MSSSHIRTPRRVLTRVGVTATAVAAVMAVSSVATAEAAPAARRAPVTAKASPSAADVLSVAASLKGTPYRYGGNGPSGFDCSGYTRYVFAKAGRSLPRTTSQQYAASRKIPLGRLRPGDLVFTRKGGAITHVGIYAGNGMVWHSPRPGKTVRLERMDWAMGRSVVAGRVT
ncbi:C40 family peptidase [Yinghuangia seranimata]|uniref:C40 family peptidase n=1 Tax=Yinghuangia seranimata TaxID=408067 RepID=UPI00248B1916|nr:C40 family peptidase [Yinghuangia seranimata]MDI2127447.1 C40 family peptidase [Yinghuangia seranimata]